MNPFKGYLRLAYSPYKVNRIITMTRAYKRDSIIDTNDRVMSNIHEAITGKFVKNKNEIS